MKLGAENRKKIIIAAVLLVVGGGLMLNGIYSSHSNDTPTPQTNAGAETTFVTTAHKAPSKTKKAVRAHSIDPSLRFDWLQASEDTKYEGTGRNIFDDQAEIPAPIAPALLANKKADNTPPPPPPPPPINLKFFGYANNPSEGKRIFLSQGEDVFIAHEGDIVDRHYKIVHIMPTSVEIEDVLNNNTQSIPLTLG
ncbi:MAG: hypothetical protein ABSE92_00075 [Terriglobales bacterium]